MLDSDHPMLPHRSCTLFGFTLLLDKPAWTRCWSFLVVWFIPCEPDGAKPGRMTEPRALPWEGDKQEASPSHTSGSREISRASDLCSDPTPFLLRFKFQSRQANSLNKTKIRVECRKQKLRGRAKEDRALLGMN